MIIYRLSTGKYANDMTGEGSRIYGGRFNPVGLATLYASENISLSILEILVRASKTTAPDSYTIVSIQIPDTGISIIQINKLKKGWQHDLDYTQGIGEDFLKENQSFCLKVPSAIVPQENNFLLNPSHPDFKKVKIISSELLELDKRLYKI
ncbi:MAG: RES family NAD+ phosphorylase [Bacteroidota bacterium]|nr:RES family NAD+ phosphorylase [Bacteroidota bacterium]